MNKKRDYSKISNKIKTKSKYLKRKYTKRIKSKLKGGSDDVSKEEVSKEELEGIEGKKNFLEDEDFIEEHQETGKFLKEKLDDVKLIRKDIESKKRDELGDRLLREYGRETLAHRLDKGRAAPRQVLGTPVKAGVSAPALEALLDAGDKKADARIKKLDSKIESLKEKERAQVEQMVAEKGVEKEAEERRIDQMLKQRSQQRGQQRQSRMLEMLAKHKKRGGFAGQKKKKRKKTKGKKPKAKKSGKKILK